MSGSIAIETAQHASGGGGSGTVTSVSVSGSNGIGVSGSPITASGTIALSLGNITPTSVVASGTVTGSNLSGTNTGNQTITLTGDVTGSGTGSFAATIGAGKVTNAMLNTQVSLAKGGTAADMSATGGVGHVVKQNSVGGAFTTGTVTVAGVPVCVRKTATTSQNANPSAWIDVDDLSIAVTSGNTYIFEAYLHCVTQHNSSMLMIGITGPTKSNLSMTVMQPPTASGVGFKTEGWETYTTANYDDAEETSASPGTSNFPVIVQGLVVVTASGNLKVRMKNSLAGASVSVKANSWFRVTQL